MAPQEPLTSFNKAQTFERAREWFEAHGSCGRRTYLVLGDKIGDLRVAEGAPESCTSIGVGIYNDRSDGEHANKPTLDYYRAAFTAVLCGDDGSLDAVTQLLERTVTA